MCVRSFPRLSELLFLLYFICITLKNKRVKYAIGNLRKTNAIWQPLPQGPLSSSLEIARKRETTLGTRLIICFLSRIYTWILPESDALWTPKPCGAALVLGTRFQSFPQGFFFNFSHPAAIIFNYSLLSFTTFIFNGIVAYYSLLMRGLRERK